MVFVPVKTGLRQGMVVVFAWTKFWDFPAKMALTVLTSSTTLDALVASVTVSMDSSVTITKPPVLLVSTNLCEIFFFLFSYSFKFSRAVCYQNIPEFLFLLQNDGLISLYYEQFCKKFVKPSICLNSLSQSKCVLFPLN